MALTPALENINREMRDLKREINNPFVVPEKVSRTHHTPKPLSSQISASHHANLTLFSSSPPSHRTPYLDILPCRFARPNLPCSCLQTPPPNLRISFCEDTLSQQIFVSLSQDEASKASYAIGRSRTTKADLGCLWWLSAVSANEEELLEGEAKHSGENKGLGGCSEVLECEVFAPVSEMLVWWEEEPGFLNALQIGCYKENFMPILGLQQR